MWKSFLIGLASLPFALLAFLIGCFSSLKAGCIAGLTVFTLGGLLAVLILLRTREITMPDIFLPIPIAVLWSLLLLPLSLGAEIFTAPTCIGSALLLSACLWMIRKGKLPNTWAIVPAMVFAYEMLPINIPGPLDDWLAFGGDTTVVLIQGVILALRKEPHSLGSGPNTFLGS